MRGVVQKWAAPLFDESLRQWSHEDVLGMTRRLEPFVGHEGRVLSFGAGVGRLGGLLAVALRCEVTIVDAGPQTPHDVEDLPHVSILHGDVTGLPFSDGFFDAVVLVHALHHLTDRRGAFQETARVLRSGGGVFVADTDPRMMSVRARALIGRALGKPGAPVAPPDLAALFMDVGIAGTIRAQSGPSYVFVGTRS